MRLERLILDPAGSSFVIDAQGRHSQAEIAARAAELSEQLVEHGVRARDRVLLLAENGAAFIYGFAGILAAGATAVIVDPALPALGVARLARVANARRICWAGRQIGEMFGTEPDLFAQVEKIGLDAAASLRGPARSPRTPPGCGADEAAVLLFTSGTTGEPKGVLLSHRAILHNVEAIADYLSPSRDDIFYVAKSMVHSSTLVGETMLAFRSGAGMVALDPAVPISELFRRVRDHGATIIGVNPSILRFFARDGLEEGRLGAIHTIHVSGSVVDPEIFRQVHRSFPKIRLINGYGLSEAGPRVSQASTSVSLKPGSVGKPIRGVTIEVRREDGSLCAAGETGEIHVSTPSRFEGYVIGGAFVEPRGADGFLPTGDLGYLDDERDLFVTGRKDDVIITGSHNVDPNLVESVIASVPGVEDCVVFGVSDKLLGQRVVCAYRVHDGVARQALAETIRAACRRALASYQIPKNFFEWSELPMGSGGKKSRKRAGELFSAEVRPR